MIPRSPGPASPQIPDLAVRWGPAENKAVLVLQGWNRIRIRFPALDIRSGPAWQEGAGPASGDPVATAWQRLGIWLGLKFPDKGKHEEVGLSGTD